MPILWIVVYCFVAVLVLFVLTFHNEMRDEQQRCDKMAQSLRVKGAKPDPKNLHHSA